MNTTISPHADKTILLSKKGMKELRQSITQLEHDRLALSRSLRESDKTTGHDDRFERNEKLLRLEALEAELAEKHHTLQRAKIMPSRKARMKVAVGSVVDLIDQQGRMFRYTLVESIEANPSDGRISVVSPLGSTLLGKTAQDSIEWSARAGTARFRLVNVT